MENFLQKDLLLTALEDSGLIDDIPPEKKANVANHYINNHVLVSSNLPKTLKFSSTMLSPKSLNTSNIKHISNESKQDLDIEIIRQTSKFDNKNSEEKILSGSKPFYKNLQNDKYYIQNPEVQFLSSNIGRPLTLTTINNQSFNSNNINYKSNIIRNHYTMKEMLHGNYNIPTPRANYIDKEATEEEMAELEDQLRHIETYADYMPKKLRYGSRHPDPVVETNSLSSVEPPGVWYTPSLPETLIDLRALSALQLEAVIYACQQHETFLPGGSRAGFLIGDGPGVGKGRTIAAIIYENYILRRKRAIWFSVSNDLKYDAERDLRDIDASKIKIAPLNKFKYKKLTAKSNGGFKKGIIFATYSSLIGERQNPLTSHTKINSHSFKSSAYSDGIFRSDFAEHLDDLTVQTGTTLIENDFTATTTTTAMKSDKKRVSKYNTRMKQLLKWCGKDFDGVIVFDECHKAKNIVTTGATKPTKTALAVLEIQRRLPKARIVYASATGATETKNMGYMVRLGLWGPGTPFQEFSDFIRAVERRGVGAMELVAMDMKLRGSYMARQLSFSGVSFLVQEAKLDDNIIEIYNASVTLWSKARNKFQIALDLFEASQDLPFQHPYSSNAINSSFAHFTSHPFYSNNNQTTSSATSTTGPTNNVVNARKKHVWAQFWAAHQRFFKYLCLATKVSLCVGLTQKALREGKCVVIGLQSTGEARTLEAVEDVGNEFMDFISTAKGIFQSLVEKHFPNTSNSFESVEGFKFKNISHQTVILNPDRPKLSKWTTARNSVLSEATTQLATAREEIFKRQRDRVEREAALKAKVAEVLNFATSKQMGGGSVQGDVGNVDDNNNIHSASSLNNEQQILQVSRDVTEAITTTNEVVSQSESGSGSEDDSDLDEEQDETRYTNSDEDETTFVGLDFEKDGTVEDLKHDLDLNESQNNTQAAAFKGKRKRRNPFSHFFDDDDDDDFDGESSPITSSNSDGHNGFNNKHHKSHKKIRKKELDQETQSSIVSSENSQLSMLSAKSVVVSQHSSSTTSSAHSQAYSVEPNVSTITDTSNNILLGSSLDNITLMKQELLAEIEELGERLPPNTLDQLIEELGGPEEVAEMTGRKGRVVALPDGSVIYESRGETDVPLEALNVIEKKRFMDGLKKVAIISEAASSGISLQSDRRALNQLRRVHITLELPWSADKAIQQFGRTHRSNQVSAPEYIFLISELAGERRFASIVAKRLESLGALTHGDRRATESRDLSQFNFDNKYGRMALDNVMRSIINPRSSIVPPPPNFRGNFYNDVRDGLIDVGMIVKDIDGYTLDKDYANIVKFLNRLLGLKVHLQNSLFQNFTDTLNAFILDAKRSGKWDMGILDFGTSSESVIPLYKQSFHFHTPRGVFSTQLWSFQVERGLSWEQAVKLYRDQQDLQDGFFISKQSKNGRVAPILALNYKSSRANKLITPSTNPQLNDTETNDADTDHQNPSDDKLSTNESNKLFNIYRPNTGLQGKLESGASLHKKYKKVPPQEVQKHWETIFNDSLTQCTHVLWKGNCRKRSTGNVCEIGIRTRKYFVLAGSVLTVWNCLEELFNAGFQAPQINNNPISASKMQIIRVKTKDGQRIVGVWIKSNYVPALIRILTRESNRTDTEDFLQGIL